MHTLERAQDTAAAKSESQWTRIVDRQAIADDVVMLVLAPIDGAPVMPFDAGAHIELQLQAGPRHYSLFNAPQERDLYRIAVRREAEGRGGSLEVFDTLVEGEIVAVRGPFNHFPLAAGAHDALLIAGGIGITPIMAMANQCRAEGASFELHYAGRNLSSMAFVDQLLSDEWQTNTWLYAAELSGTARLDVAQVISAPASDRHLYVCGPSRLIEAVIAAATDKGWPPSHVHFERFGADVTPPGNGDQPFELEIASNGQRITVSAEETAADALARAGVAIPTSCGSGVCGACCTRLKGGTPDHRDLYLSPEEQARGDRFTPCCSRAVTPLLVLDL